ncbi:MAG: enolase C-terminal domain-like protein [Candidatus Daviesbacteria bacterium]|nr:enolase C-terminal domain-like protein [Candidatus Daviesbacteria bacterium]
MQVDNLHLKIISDSRGKSTLEAEMESEGISVISSVPSGKSTGKGEALSIDPEKALAKIDWIKSQLKGHEFATLDQFDNLLITLDGTPDKSRLGANLILVLSIAFTKLLAKKGNMEIYELIAKLSDSVPVAPRCFFNVINGGLHSKNSLPFQEYIFVPENNSPKKNLEEVMVVIKNLEDIITKKYGNLRQGDEGGYEVPENDPKIGLEILSEASSAIGGSRLAMDVAASTFYQDGKYDVGGKIMSSDELLSYYQLLTQNYKLLSIEDPFAEDNWEGFTKITKELGEKIWIIGDDLTTTNVKSIKRAYEKNAINGVIIKPNQIGSVSETLQAVNLAKNYGWKIIVSHRSGETMDTFIADLAVGVSADGLKSGCPLQKERLVKYQRLEEIESRIKNNE